MHVQVLQLMGALYMGNKVVVKNHSFTSVVTEQWVRLLHHCGMPTDDVDIIHSEGPVMGE
jgi:1-pyrroline-5-carboxylate dehydrogenase